MTDHADLIVKILGRPEGEQLRPEVVRNRGRWYVLWLDRYGLLVWVTGPFLRYQAAERDARTPMRDAT